MHTLNAHTPHLMCNPDYRHALTIDTSPLQALSDLSVRACASSELPRQYYSSAIIAGINAPFERAPSRSDRLASRAKAVPIMDINQIYAQATCVHTLLLSVARSLATVSQLLALK